MQKKSMFSISLWLALSLCTSGIGAERKDTRGGFLNYENNKTQNLTEKDILLNILAEQRKQTAIQSEILEILKITHDLPRKVVINGKECISNSSSDCFVMPIIGDAARLPVMRKWLENPTVENALEYYKWQSKYLNHTFNVGYSLEFAAKNTTYPFASTPTYLSTGSDQANVQRRSYALDVFKKHATNMEVAILLGKNFGYDVEYTYDVMKNYNTFKELGIRTRFIFENEKTLALFNDFHQKSLNPELNNMWKNIPKADKVISPNTFKDTKFEAHLTPMYVLRYNDIGKKQSFTQVIGIGREAQKNMLRSIQQALILFKIVDPQDFSGSHAESYQTRDLIKELKTRSYINDEEAKKNAPAFIQMLETQLPKK